MWCNTSRSKVRVIFQIEWEPAATATAQLWEPQSDLAPISEFPNLSREQMAFCGTYKCRYGKMMERCSGNVQQNIFSAHQLHLLFEWASISWTYSGAGDQVFWFQTEGNRSPQWNFSFTCSSTKIGFGSKIMWGKAATCSIWSVAHPWACLELEKQVSLEHKQASNISTHLPWSSCLKNILQIS